MTRTAWIVSASLGVLLVIAIIVGFVVVGEIRAQDEQRAFENCMASNGHPVDDQAPAIRNDGELSAYIDDSLEAANRCLR